jgi:uncharacterized protein YpmB
MKISKGTAMLGILGGGLALVLGQLGNVGQKHHKTVESAVELVKENTEIKHANDTLVAATIELKQVIKQKDEQIHQLDSIVEKATSTPAPTRKRDDDDDLGSGKKFTIGAISDN